MRKIVIALLILLGIVFIGFLVLWSVNYFFSCTAVGCVNTLSVTLPEELPSRNFVILADSSIILDPCNDIRAGSSGIVTQGTTIGMSPYYPGKPRTEENLIRDIGSLQIGYRETCADDVTFVYSYQDVKTTYRTHNPNGPFCSPTCYNGTIVVK
ncbi:hypothetical protein IIC68_00840 [archaeon]|nr:hypothetical protein [archaeon]